MPKLLKLTHPDGRTAIVEDFQLAEFTEAGFEDPAVEPKPDSDPDKDQKNTGKKK